MNKSAIKSLFKTSCIFGSQQIEAQWGSSFLLRLWVECLVLNEQRLEQWGTPYSLQDELPVDTLLIRNTYYCVSGELDRLQKFWLAGACHAQKDKKDKTSHKIGILNFTSAFILLAAGVTLATILLLLEHFYFKFGRRCLKKYDKTGCCALVSLVSNHEISLANMRFEDFCIKN